MHLDEPVVVWCRPVDDDKEKVVVLVKFGALVELLRVFDRERMKLEDIAEDLEVILAWLIEVEPKEVAAGVQSLDCLTIEVDLAAAVILDDVRDRGAGARGRYAAIRTLRRFVGRGRTVARRRGVLH
jgi:tricorn protease-like protein